MVTDHKLTFSPSVLSLPILINITSDGDFEETEHFAVILSVRDFDLQLNITNRTAVNLRQRVCMDKEVFSVAGSDEMVNIDLDRIFVAETRNRISFNLAANESERVSVSPAKTNITILDNDSKTKLNTFLCPISVYSYLKNTSWDDQCTPCIPPLAITIGFSATSYYVNECHDQVNIIIAVLNHGSLKKEVTLHLSTNDLTANGNPSKIFVE